MSTGGGAFLKPVFDVAAVDILSRPGGRPVFLSRCRLPALAHLHDWRLLTWLEGRETLVFGGIHPDFMRLAAPFTAFFRVDGVCPTVMGYVEAATFCDFVAVDGDGRVEGNLVWTHVQRELVTRRAMASGGLVE